MKKHILLIGLIAVFSCQSFDEEAIYTQKLVVFGHLMANLPMLEPIHVSRSSEIDEKIPSSELYVSNASVKVFHGGETFIAVPDSANPGQYRTPPNVIYLPGETYILEVAFEDDTVRSVTTIPANMDFESPDGFTYNCDGEEVDIPGINVDNFDIQNPLPTGTIDTITYRTDGCYAQSFASVPYFSLQFQEELYSTIQTVTLALEADVRGLEPYDDLNNNGQFDDDSDSWLDYNRNGVRDSTFTNVIYDTSDVFSIWKGSYFRDENNDPRPLSTFVWNITESPTPFTWLNFNYYGLHLVYLQATDDAYFNYFSGDPFGLNQYALPDSNIEGGYGMFSSSYGRGFYVVVQPQGEDS